MTIKSLVEASERRVQWPLKAVARVQIPLGGYQVSPQISRAGSSSDKGDFVKNWVAFAFVLLVGLGVLASACFCDESFAGE